MVTVTEGLPRVTTLVTAPTAIWCPFYESNFRPKSFRLFLLLQTTFAERNESDNRRTKKESHIFNQLTLIRFFA
jgi:hypothetical protein